MNNRTKKEVSISSTFYEQLFRTKVLCTAILYLQFLFVFFGDWHKKAARKMLVKLTTTGR